MRKFLLFLLLPLIIFAQEESYVGELRIALINCSGSVNITFTLTAIGAKWDDNYDLTENYSSVSDVVTSCSDYAEFDHILDPSPRNPEYAVGLYKISAIVNSVEQAYFFMDWRTSNWNSSLDVEFKYDVGNTIFRDWDNTQTIDYTYQTLWDLSNNYLVTSGLENYWVNCLAMTSDSDNHPRFVFGPYPGSLQGTIIGYKIYRSAPHAPGQQPSNFTLLETLEPDEYFYIDNTVIIGNDYNARSYYVTCIYEYPWESPGETIPTNIVEVRLQIPQKIAVPENIIEQKFDYKLNQNFPNPFNPTTIIGYSLSESEQVTLKVYDLLGKEIIILVDEKKEAGNHLIEFNASNLPSGIYFYQIQTGKYSETRKLILQK